MSYTKDLVLRENPLADFRLVGGTRNTADLYLYSFTGTDVLDRRQRYDRADIAAPGEPPGDVTGTGAFAAAAAQLAGTGTETFEGTGAFAAVAAAFAGTGAEEFTGTGNLAAAAAILSGTGTETLSGTGAVALAAAVLAAVGTETFAGTGNLAAVAAAFAAAGNESISGTSAYLSLAAILAGAGGVPDNYGDTLVYIVGDRVQFRHNRR